MSKNKDQKIANGFIFGDAPDVPPWVKETTVEKIVWAANERRDINEGPQGVHPSENGVPDDSGSEKTQAVERTAIRTGHHPDNVFECFDPIRLSAAFVDDLAKENPRFAQIFHGSLAEPKLFVPTYTSPFASTKTSPTENPLYFDNRKISGPQRQRVREWKYRLFDVFLSAGIIRKGEKE